MKTNSKLTSHVMAFAAALLISGTLMVNTLAVSAKEVHSVAGILA